MRPRKLSEKALSVGAAARAVVVEEISDHVKSANLWGRVLHTERDVGIAARRGLERVEQLGLVAI